MDKCGSNNSQKTGWQAGNSDALAKRSSAVAKDGLLTTCSHHCAGEIGQVGKSTYLHGFTAAVGILRETLEVEEPAQIPQQELPETPPEGQ